MEKLIYDQLWIFFVYSFVGWVIGTILAAYRRKRFVDVDIQEGDIDGTIVPYINSLIETMKGTQYTVGIYIKFFKTIIIFFPIFFIYNDRADIMNKQIIIHDCR